MESRRPSLRTAVVTTVTALAVIGPPGVEGKATAAVIYPVTAVIPVGNSPQGIALSPATHRAYVTNYGAATVSVIDTTTNSVVATVPVGQHPDGVVLDVTSGSVAAQRSALLPVVQPPPTIFVENSADHSLSVIDGGTNGVVATIALPNSKPYTLAVDTSLHRIFAGGFDSTGTQGFLALVDDVHRTVTDTFVMGKGYFDSAIDPGEHKLFLPDHAGNVVSVFNTSTLSPNTPTGIAQPEAVAVDAVAHKVYVTSFVTTGQVSVIDEDTGAITASIPVSQNPTYVGVDSVNHTIYVADDAGVQIIDGTTNKVVATAPVASASGIAVDSSTHTAYAVSLSGTVSVISRQGPIVARLAGPDRFGTAVAVSQALFPNGGAEAVVLARGDDYPDALVGAPLATARHAPLLLTAGATLPTATKDELTRVLAPGKTVYILGGTLAVPASVATEISGLGYQVVRYSGSNRFETAVQVADALGDPSTVLLATGTNFPDALSAGVAATQKGGVVLLTNGSQLPDVTSAYLSAHATAVYAVGGPAATADPSATPLFGSDRYATAVAVANKFFVTPATVGLATGLSFPDALSGGALLAKWGAPLMLVSTSSVPPSVSDYLASAKASVTTAYLFGGTVTINASVQTSVTTLLGT